MSDQTLQLCDGTHLSDVRDQDGRPRGIDSMTGKRGTYHGDAGGGRLVDHHGATIREVVPQPAGTSSSRTKSSSSSPPKRVSRERFATFNAFIDTVARHLSPLEVVVWAILFRDCRDGTVSTSNRDLARRSGCSLRAVHNAVQGLRATGLITAVKLSTNKGQPSVYAVHPEPDRMVPDLVDRTAQRTDARRASVANP